MQRARMGLVDNTPSSLQHAAAKVDILHMQEIAFIKSAHAAKGVAIHHEEGA